MMAPTKPKMYPITAVITMSTTAAIGSNGLTKYTGLIMCAQKTKSRIGCAPADQNKKRPSNMPVADHVAITNPTLWGLGIISQCHSDRRRRISNQILIDLPKIDRDVSLPST